MSLMLLPDLKKYEHTSININQNNEDMINGVW